MTYDLQEAITKRDQLQKDYQACFSLKERMEKDCISHRQELGELKEKHKTLTLAKVRDDMSMVVDQEEIEKYRDEMEKTL